jgi:hypothetical protein
MMLHHNGIQRGVFDRGAASVFVYELDLTDPAWAMQPAANGAMLKWKKECLALPPRAL